MQQRRHTPKKIVADGQAQAEAGSPPEGLRLWRTHTGERETSKKEGAVEEKCEKEGAAERNRYVLSPASCTACQPQQRD